MSGGQQRQRFLYDLPPSLLWEFCRVMDGLSDLEWTRFASEVLPNQADVRLAEREKRRTNWVMNILGNKNQRVGYLVDVLERLELLHPRDILLCWLSSFVPSPLPPPPPPSSMVSIPHSDPPLSKPEAPPTLSTVKLSPAGGGASALPRPVPPPSYLYSDVQQPVQPVSMVTCNVAVMRWPYEEVHAGTEGFSPALRVGEGGFGVVYRASLRNIDCAVKRLKQDGTLDWKLLKESFISEVEKLSRFQHPNIVNLIGFSEGGGALCLIYSYMHNRSLEDQLHNECAVLSWPHRVSILEGASAALQFLHCPPGGQQCVIHGDVKSANILLDGHMVAKLSDFGLARFLSRAASSSTATASIARTETVRGTLAYLPEENWHNGELGTALDVYSFGVVLLEVLTGRRALETDGSSRPRYLKDLVEELQDDPSGSSGETWKRQLDKRVTAGGDAEPAGYLQLVALACQSLRKFRKKRPSMTQIFSSLKDVNTLVKKSSWSSEPPNGPPRSLDSSMDALTQQLSRLGPRQNTDSSFTSLPLPHSLHSSSSSSSCSSSFLGPCETDESRGFSQYHRTRSNGTGCRTLSQCCQRSVPTEDQYPVRDPPSCSANSVLAAQAFSGGLNMAGLQGPSPVQSLQSTSPGTPVVINPMKQRLLEKNAQYEEGRIQTPELLSSDDLYGGRSFGDIRSPEESDELDFLPSRHN